jgi:hypothetical protein
LYNSNNEEEHEKLITLFETMKKLEEINIHLVDLTDNIIDNGQRYVIIDLELFELGNIVGQSFFMFVVNKFQIYA